MDQGPIPGGYEQISDYLKEAMDMANTLYENGYGPQVLPALYCLPLSEDNPEVLPCFAGGRLLNNFRKRKVENGWC